MIVNHAKHVLQVILSKLQIIRASGSDINHNAVAQSRTPYERPTLRKLTPEQAKLLLIGHVSFGEEGAKDVLELLFAESDIARIDA